MLHIQSMQQAPVTLFISIAGSCAGESFVVSCGGDNPGNNPYRRCKVGENNNKIVDVFVRSTFSGSECNFADHHNDHDDIGVYGYKNKHIWVDNGCAGLFEVCLEGKLIFTFVSFYISAVQ